MTSDPYALPAPAAVPVRPRRARPAYPAPVSWLPLAALATGVLAAFAIVDHPFGLGTVLTVGAVGATIGAAVWRRPSRSDVALAAGMAALLAMVLVRAAEWLLVLDLLVVAALGTIVLAGARTWEAFAAAGVTVWARLAPALPYLLGPLARSSTRAAVDPARRSVWRGAATAAVLLLVFGALFASADAAFATLLGALVPDFEVSDVLAGRMLAGTFTLALVGAGVLTRLRPLAAPALAAPRERPRAEWAVPLVALDALYAAFVIVQLAVLFGGREHVLRTSGLTYAEYARQGFFQLVVVVVLTLALIGFVVAKVSFEDARERLVARAALLPLCGLAFVVLASAWRRLALYESVYGLTRLRLLVHAAIVGLAIVLALVVAALVLWDAAWLPRACAGAVAVTLLGLNAVNPDALIAHRAADIGRIDAAYLSGLSADAAPALAPLGICVEQPDDESWLSWNLARSRAEGIRC